MSIINADGRLIHSVWFLPIAKDGGEGDLLGCISARGDGAWEHRFRLRVHVDDRVIGSDDRKTIFSKIYPTVEAAVLGRDGIIDTMRPLAIAPLDIVLLETGDVDRILGTLSKYSWCHAVPTAPGGTS